MEKRLTAQGPKDRKSYTVTLPLEWVKREKLDKSRIVELDIIGNKVVVAPIREIQDRVLISGDDYSSSLIKVLQGLYRVGINEIKLTFNDNKLLEEASAIIEKCLIGYEIIEQKEDYLVVKDITKESQEDFQAILRRIFLLLLEMSESRDAVQVQTLDKNIKKLINYCQRILMKKGHADFLKTPLYYLLLDRLEKIGDEFKWLLKTKGHKDVKEIQLIFREAYELFYKFDSKRFDKAQSKSYILKNKFKNEIKNLHEHNLARLLNSLYGDIFVLKY